MKVTLKNVEMRLVLSPMSGNRLPKKAGSVEVVVNGTPFAAPVTTNAAWAAEGKTLEYIWIEVDGKAYYLTLDYGVKASDMKGETLTTAEGTATRVDPVRVTKDPVKETARIQAFKTTWAARAA